MLYSLLLITFGVFLGQEYPLPSVKFVFNNIVEFLDTKKRGVPKGLYRGEFEFTELNNEDSSDSDSDSDATLTPNEPQNNETHSENVKNCNIQ